MQPIPGSPPPALLAMLAQHGAAPQQQPQPKQAPVEMLKKVVNDLHAWLQVEPDEQDKAQGMKMLAGLQSLIAKDQQDQDTLMGGSSSVQRALRKSV